jgi:hypothetical protein
MAFGTYGEAANEIRVAKETAYAKEQQAEAAA